MRKKHSILAVIVIYFPDPNLLSANINELYHFVDKIVLWNNGSSKNDLKYDDAKIEVLGNGNNIGISKALNAALRYAKENGFDYFLTMDQDSVWVNLEGFLQKVLSLEDTMNIFGPEYFLTDKVTIREDEYRITSGMFLPVALLDNIGGYYEDFLIDGIDVELCCRARKYGYKVYYISGSTLNHHPGSNLKCRFMGVNFNSDGYSPTRIFGIIRNHIIIFKNYRISWKNIKYPFLHYYLRMPIKILFGEEEKCEKLKAFLKGLSRGMHDPYLN